MAADGDLRQLVQFSRGDDRRKDLLFVCMPAMYTSWHKCDPIEASLPVDGSHTL